MNWAAIRAVMAKDLTAVRRSKAVVLPMLFVPILLLVVLPLFIGLAARAQHNFDISRFLDNVPGDLAQPIRELPVNQQLIVLVNGYLLAPLFLARSGWRELQGLDAAGWTAVLFLGLGCSGLGYLLWYGALEKLEASRVAAFLYLEPLVTLTAGAAVLHEPVTGTAVAGGMLVLAAVVLVQRRSARALRR